MVYNDGFTRITDDSAYTKAVSSLDVYQHEAAFSEVQNVAIRAGAGSGKTKTLIAAVAIYRYNNVNDTIHAITYTRAARAEMQSRLEALGVYDANVSTIHAWARDRLAEFAQRYNFKVRVLEEPQIRIILQEVTSKYLLTSKVKSVNLDILYSYITGSRKMEISDNFRRTLNAIENRYIEYKHDNNLYDFTDFPQYLYDVMEAYDEYIDTIDALFVDEFQDVDPIQLKIFDRVRAKKKFYIGDPWQSIYIFRNADGEVFNKLPDFEVYRLKANYRSCQEIIDYATTVYLRLYEKALEEEPVYISMIMRNDESAIECKRGDGGEVYIINPFGRNVRFGNCHLPQDSTALFNEFMKRDPMILCRTNKQVKAIRQLGYFNVDTIHQAKGLEYENVIMIDSTIDGIEDLNIAYVGMTRAEDSLLVINWTQLEMLFTVYMKKMAFGGK